MRKERDAQKGKLYRAEMVLRAASARLETVAEMEGFAASVLARAPVQSRYGAHLRRPIEVRDGRGRVNACGGSEFIKMPKWSRTQYIVLHELAHSICQRKHGIWVAGHGWQFAAIYLDLVWFGMGAEARDVLKASFKANRVCYAAPRAATTLAQAA